MEILFVLSVVTLLKIRRLKNEHKNIHRRRHKGKLFKRITTRISRRNCGGINMNIGFEAIVEKCVTLSDVLELEEQFGDVDLK